MSEQKVEHATITKQMAEDKIERILELLMDFFNGVEAECVRIKSEIKKLAEYELGLKEEVFNVLNWEEKQSERLGRFEVADKDKNDFNAWNHAYNILRVNGATIRDHFGSGDWEYYYWLFDGSPNLIYRKKRREKA